MKSEKRRSVTLTEAEWVAVSEALEIAAGRYREVARQGAILRVEGAAPRLLAASRLCERLVGQVDANEWLEAGTTSVARK